MEVIIVSQNDQLYEASEECLLQKNCSQSYKHFLIVNYNSRVALTTSLLYRVVIYNCRVFVRLASDHLGAHLLQKFKTITTFRLVAISFDYAVGYKVVA